MAQADQSMMGAPNGAAWNPQFDPEQYVALQRRQQIANALLQQGMQMPQGQMVSGHYVAPSALSYLADALTAYGGYKAGTKASADLMNMQMANQRAMAEGYFHSHGMAAPWENGNQAHGMLAPWENGNQGTAVNSPANGSMNAPAGNGPVQTGSQASMPSPAGQQTGLPAQSQPTAQPIQGAPTSSGGLSLPNINNDPTYQNLLGADFYANMTGMPGGQAQDYAKAYYQANMPLDFQKALVSQGIAPGSPQWNQAMSQYASKQTFIAPVQVGQGTLAVDPLTKTPIVYNPKLAEGVIPSYGNGPMPTGASQLPGYAGANAAITGAENAAKVGTNLYQQTGPTGQPYFMTGREAIGGGQGMPAAPAPQPGAVRGDFTNPAQALADIQRIQDPNLRAQAMQAYTNQMTGQNPGYGAPTPGMASRPLGAGPGVATNIQESVKQGSNLYTNATQDAANIPAYHSFLNDAWNLVNQPNVKFGPGSEGLSKLGAIASQYGINLSGAQTNRDVMTKIANYLASSQMGGGGTDKQLETLLHSNPNADMTPDAIKQVIPMLVSQLDVKQARANVLNNAMQANGGDRSQLPNIANQFNQLADPGTVSLGIQFNRAMQSGGRDAVTALDNQMRQHYGAAWPSIKAKIQKLDDMGAF